MSSRSRLRSIRLLSLLLIPVVLSMTGSPLSRSTQAASPAQEETSKVVERWRGKMHVQASVNGTILSFGALPGIFRETYTLDFDLKVYEDGFVNGDVIANFSSLSFDQQGEVCGFIFKCRVGASLGNPVAHTFVEGQRTPAQNNEAEIILKKEIQITPGTMIVRTAIGGYTSSGVEKIYADVLPVAPLKITFHGLGRQPTAESRNPHISSSVVDFAVQGQLIATGEEPLLDLDAELLERSVFLAQVPVEDNFDANVDWNSVDAGWVTWQFADEAPERVGPTRSKKIPKKVNVGPPNPGQRTLQVQAHNTSGKDSAPQTSKVTVAPPVKADDTRTSPVTGEKKGDVVAYKFAIKFPEPPFKAQVKQLPNGIPFFDRGPLGIDNTQAVGEVEVNSSGEGSGKAGVNTGFEAMGSEVRGQIAVATKAVLTPAGLTFPEGEFELELSGKLTGEEALIVLVPSIGPAVGGIAKRFPAVASVINKAKVILEFEPKLALSFTLKDNNGDIEFVEGKAKPAMGVGAALEIELVEDVLSATAGVGGEVAVTLKVPAPYTDGYEIKLKATAQIVLYHWAYSGEASVSGKFGGSLATVNKQQWDAQQQRWVPMTDEVSGANWVLADRGYLDDPNYGRWSASSMAPQDDRFGPTDKELVANVFPQANPSLAVHLQNGIAKPGMVWAHEQPNSPPLSGQDIMFTQGTVAYKVSKDGDNRADLNPKLVFLPKNPASNQLIVWQRFDTADLGTQADFNADPAAYLSHAQIAAVPFNYNSSARKEPQQLSTSGSLNYRHQVGATNDGAMAVWINNPANQILGDVANPDKVLFARYTQTNDTGSWSPVGTVIPSVAGLVDYKLATNGSHAALIYSRDMDGDMTSDGDRELFYTQLAGTSWSTPVQLSNNTNVADEKPQLILATDGTPLAVWRQAGQLKFLKGGWNSTPETLALPEAALRSDFDLVASSDGSAALTWQEVEASETRVGYAIYDAAQGRWSGVQSAPTNTATMPGATTMANNITAALAPSNEFVENSRSRLFLGYQLASVQAVTETIDGVDYPNTLKLGPQSLHLASVPMRTNLSVSPADLRVTPATAAPGDPLTVSAVIRNTGDLATPGGKIPVILKTQNQDLETTVVMTHTLPALSAGEAVTLTYPLTRPALGDKIYAVVIDPVDESFSHKHRETTYNDNEAAVGSELAISAAATEYASTGAVARALITQSGGLYNGLVVSSTLHLGTRDGPVVGQAPISFPVTPTDTIIASSFISSTVLGPGSHQLWWKIDPEGALGESKLDDNLTGTTVNIMPDLATDATLVGWGSEPGNTAPISLRVENEGSWASGSSFVEIWDGEPGKPGTHSLGRIAVPPIEAGGYAELSGSLNLAGLPAATTGLTSIYLQLDPDQTITETNENNNVVLAGGVLGGEYPTDVPLPAENKIYLPFVRR